MKYIEALQKFGENYNPFSNINKKDTIDESKNFFVIPARSPYVDNHIMIIPKKEIYLLKDLSEEEKKEMRDIINDRTDKLHKKHKSVNLLLRDGIVWWNCGKSINHLHFHLIPDCWVTASHISDPSLRIWLEDNDYTKILKKMKIDFL